MTWQAPAAGATDVTVYRSNEIIELGEVVGRPAAGATAWTDTGTQPDRTYWYRVAATTAEGVLTSNPVAARTPRYELGEAFRQVAVSARDEYLHVFGQLANGFPQVIRISPDGSVVEQRDAAFIGPIRFAPAYDGFVDEVWVAEPGKVGVVAFRGEAGALPQERRTAVREGGSLIETWPRLGYVSGPLVAVDEVERTVRLEPVASSGTSGSNAIDCVSALSTCWLGRGAGGTLRGFEVGTLATFQLSDARPGLAAQTIFADPRDGGAWIFFSRYRLVHVDRSGTILADTTLTGELVPEVVSGDLERDRALWTAGGSGTGPYRLYRIDVDAPVLTLEEVAQVPRYSRIVRDLQGGVWVVNGDEATRVGRDGGTLVTVPLLGAR